MSEEEFLAALTGRSDDLRLAVEAMKATGQPFCLIGGLAVNHFVEPVVTLDADFAIAGPDGLVEAMRTRGFVVETFPHSINAQLPGSRLRLQITINSRYATFPDHAAPASVFGVAMPVASLGDLVQGKLWAATDPVRRATKRQKDRLDLARLAEAYPDILIRIPVGLIPEVDEVKGEDRIE